MAAQAQSGINMIAEPQAAAYVGIIIAVACRQFAEMGAQHIHSPGKTQHVLYDLKNGPPIDASDLRL